MAGGTEGRGRVEFAAHDFVNILIAKRLNVCGKKPNNHAVLFSVPRRPPEASILATGTKTLFLISQDIISSN